MSKTLLETILDERIRPSQDELATAIDELFATAQELRATASLEEGPNVARAHELERVGSYLEYIRAVLSREERKSEIEGSCH